MQINLDKYTPVSVSATCKLCGSTSVKEEQSKAGRPYLVEIFTMGDEEVSARNDFHSRYCPMDRVLKKVVDPKAIALIARNGRQNEITKLYAAELDKLGIDDQEPKIDLPEPTPEPEPHEPVRVRSNTLNYPCTGCGGWIYDGAEDLHYNAVTGKTHSCGDFIDMLSVQHLAAQQKGARVALKVPFVEISERMDSTERIGLDEISFTDLERIEAIAEYAYLKKRLYTEIPATGRR